MLVSSLVFPVEYFLFPKSKLYIVSPSFYSDMEKKKKERKKTKRLATPPKNRRLCCVKGISQKVENGKKSFVHIKEEVQQTIYRRMRIKFEDNRISWSSSRSTLNQRVFGSEHS
ncbi:hypothetical protein I7I50_10882 [Histoplasma capsulatum G186AR]|uniref:Uncharacterized protein n=1 Tax=Ajellomyces capsulatus TaxID=5037 RepID=A0A8H7Z8X3_AJECA|nr:hypothetical protein I7I52_02121 [Histoplasma capsulatum]QSS69555.1 hypothetical protein I7I50_10882 [Histoplasma capsulatum G186AR]